MVNLVRQNYRKNLKSFKCLKRQLINVLDNKVIIEHIGSTSIPKMSGKDIIDILIGVCDASEFKKCVKDIERAGYFRGNGQPIDDYMFFASKKEETQKGDVHIHLAIKNSERFNDFLALKKYLLDKPDVAKEYSSLKYKLVKISSGDRREYKKMKSEYVSNLLKKARDYYGKIS